MRNMMLLAVLLTCLFIGSMVTAQEQMCVPMGDITIEPLAQKAKRQAVTFPHAVHFDYSCQKCHHQWDGEKSIDSCSTSGCHGMAEKPDTKNRGKKILYYKSAYHEMCIGCHKDIKMNNKKLESTLLGVSKKISPTGPTGCNECHPKE
ncbi:MAG: cytochrome c3 family protein [Desulfobacteraceae bacterium]|nr:cytochrome c3 family protein [Desulfobacteraceae bacterium]